MKIFNKNALRRSSLNQYPLRSQHGIDKVLKVYQIKVQQKIFKIIVLKH